MRPDKRCGNVFGSPRFDLGRRFTGNVDLVAGGAVIERTYHPESDRTEMAVVPASGKFEMVFTVNNRQRGGELVWDDAVVIRAGLGETEDTYAVRLLPRVFQGTMPRAEWEVGDKLEILDVTGANIREWGVLAADAGRSCGLSFRSGDRRGGNRSGSAR